MMNLSGRTALVTGAASGIGRALAIALADRRCNVALADIDKAGLDDVASVLSPAVCVSRHHLDLSDPAAIASLPDEVRRRHSQLDLLVNNAGVALKGSFQEVAAEDFDWLMSVNFFGVVRMTRAFLPLLMTSQDARVVNVSSLFGLIAPPNNTAYVSSKFAIRGFSEALRHELAETTIGVSVVHPGGVATSISANARPPRGAGRQESSTSFEKKLSLPPSTAAETILRGIERRRPRIIVGADAKLASVVERLAPVSYWKLLQLAAAQS